MQRPTISFFIPACNATKYLNKTVKSVLIQIFEDFELLIIDDGSSDNTREITTLFDYRSIQYSCHLNQGKLQACNNGIYKSKG